MGNSYVTEERPSLAELQRHLNTGSPLASKMHTKSFDSSSKSKLFDQTLGGASPRSSFGRVYEAEYSDGLVQTDTDTDEDIATGYYSQNIFDI